MSFVRNQVRKITTPVDERKQQEKIKLVLTLAQYLFVILSAANLSRGKFKSGTVVLLIGLYLEKTLAKCCIAFGNEGKLGKYITENYSSLSKLTNFSHPVYKNVSSAMEKDFEYANDYFKKKS